MRRREGADGMDDGRRDGGTDVSRYVQHDHSDVRGVSAQLLNAAARWRSANGAT